MPDTERRVTRQRAAVADLLERTEDFRSAQDLHARLRSSGNPSGSPRSTAPCRRLAADGEVDVLRTADGEAVYRRCSTGHHHHLVAAPAGARWRSRGRRGAWAERVSREHGFSDVAHTLEIVGTCADCAG